MNQSLLNICSASSNLKPERKVNRVELSQPRRIEKPENPSVGCLVPPPERVGSGNSAKQSIMGSGWAKERQVTAEGGSGMIFLWTRSSRVVRASDFKNAKVATVPGGFIPTSSDTVEYGRQMKQYRIKYFQISSK
jgi:hypothetical protein